MSLREKQEEKERVFLSPYAVFSENTKGRQWPEEQCDIRTVFQRDRDRIIHCKAFRRMKHKTQVFISPEGDHYRTRLTHTLEVAQIARTIARALSLNEDLTEAIALGHDLGHTPFGHAGEKVLNEICPGGFEHCSQSLRVVERLEKDGKGLNLTWEVRDGIVNHRSAGNPSTLEGKIVRLSDKIAYINHDIDDAGRAGILKEDEIPREMIEVVGSSASRRINTMIRDVVKNSQDKNDIITSDVMKKAMKDLRAFMFQRVYLDERAEAEQSKVENILVSLYHYYSQHPLEMTDEFHMLLKEGEAPELVARDFVAGMTDRFAINQYTKLFIPKSWEKV